MHTNVTQRHIDEGKQGNRFDCAIARSIKESTGERRVLVNGSGAFIGHQRFDIGDKGRDFIRAFDQDKSLVAPTDLTLSPYFSRAETVHDWQYQMYKAQQTQMYANTIAKYDHKMMAWQIMDEASTVPESVYAHKLVTMAYPKEYKAKFIGMDFGV